MPKRGRVSNRINRNSRTREKKGFLYWAFLASFFLMLELVLFFTPYFFLAFLLCLFTVASIVFSIINIIRQKNKRFSIVTLVISVLVLLLIITVSILVMSHYLYFR